MATHRIQIPRNYEQTRELGSIVSQTIDHRRVPPPDSIDATLGIEALPSYYLMHALFHSLEQGSVQGLVDYARRDGRAIQVHSYDAAVKPSYRFDDDRLPSGYILTPREEKGVLVHDLGEEFGRTLLGALVVNDAIGYLTSNEIGQDAESLTNRNALLLGPLRKELEAMKTASVNPESVYRAFKNLEFRVEVTPQDVKSEYQRILNALTSFGAYVAREVDYIEIPQRRYLTTIVDALSNRLREKTIDPPAAGTLADSLHKQYGHVIGIIERGNYPQVEKRLLVPGDSEFFIALKKAFYLDFVNDIAGNAQRNLGSNGGNPSNVDSYLAPMMEKLAESTDTVARWDAITFHAISIFRKSSVLIRQGTELVKYLNQRGVDTERLRRAVDYHYRNLKASVIQYHDNAKGNVQHLAETSHQEDLGKYEVMKGKLGELEQRVAEMNKSSLHDSGRRNAMGRFLKILLLLSPYSRRR